MMCFSVQHEAVYMLNRSTVEESASKALSAGCRTLPGLLTLTLQINMCWQMSKNYNIYNSYFVIAVFHVQCDFLTGESVWTIYQIKNFF